MNPRRPVLLAAAVLAAACGGGEDALNGPPVSPKVSSASENMTTRSVGAVTSGLSGRTCFPDAETPLTEEQRAALNEDLAQA